MKQFMKKINEYGLTTYRYYDLENSTVLNIDRYGIEFSTDQDIEWEISNDLKNGFKFILESEFMDAYKEIDLKLNAITEKL